MRHATEKKITSKVHVAGALARVTRGMDRSKGAIAALRKGALEGKFKLGGSSQQPNITALSVPAGARNNAAFVSATTVASGCFVFRPGATFPDNGPVSQNVYTTGNSVGTDGLVLLQNTLQGLGLFPTNALATCTIFLDFSLVGDEYTLTADLTFPPNCTIVGLCNPANGVFPTLTCSTFQLKFFPREVRDVLLVCPTIGHTPAFDPPSGFFTQYLKLSGNTAISGGSDAAYCLALMAEGAVLVLEDNAQIGDGINIFIELGGPNPIFLGSGTVVSDFALSAIGGVILAEPGATFDQALYLACGFIQVGTFGSGLYIFDPTSVDPAGNLFNDLENLCAAISLFEGDSTIFFAPGADGYTIPFAEYDFGTRCSWFFAGEISVSSDSGVILANSPLEVAAPSAGATFTGLSTTESLFPGSETIVFRNMNLFSTGGFPLSGGGGIVANFENCNIPGDSSGPTFLVGTANIGGEGVGSTVGDNVNAAIIGSSEIVVAANSLLASNSIAGSGAITPLPGAIIDPSIWAQFPGAVTTWGISAQIAPEVLETSFDAALEVPTTHVNVDVSVAGDVTLTLPPGATVPYDGYRVRTQIVVGDGGASAMIVQVDNPSTEKLMNPSTGDYQTTPWSTGDGGGGNRQGSYVWWTWRLSALSWLSEGSF